MDFLINESQLRLILQEQDQSKMSDYMRELYSFTSNLVTKAKKTYGLNLKLLLTWGASVGGLVMPLDNFIRTGRFEISDEQATLLLIGVACAFFYDNTKVFKKAQQIETIRTDKRIINYFIYLVSQKDSNTTNRKVNELLIGMKNYIEDIEESYYNNISLTIG